MDHNLCSEFPFFPIENETEFRMYINDLRYDNSFVDLNRLDKLVFNIFDTNSKDPIVSDPDHNFDLYRDIEETMQVNSRYYVEEGLNKYKKNSDLSFLHHNIRSCVSHYNDFL